MVPPDPSLVRRSMSLVRSVGERAAVEPAKGIVGMAGGATEIMGAAKPAVDTVTLVRWTSIAVMAAARLRFASRG